MDKNCLSHSAWKYQFHIVFIPKYRKTECIKLYGIFERAKYADDI